MSDLIDSIDPEKCTIIGYEPCTCTRESLEQTKEPELSGCPACGHEKHIGEHCNRIMFESGTVCRCNDDQARKADAGKPSGYRMIPWHSIAELAAIYVYGAKKYAPNSWRLVENAVPRYEDALMRHLSAYFSGEVTDSESGLRHLAHALWNVIALMELTRKKEK